MLSCERRKPAKKWQLRSTGYASSPCTSSMLCFTATRRLSSVGACMRSELGWIHLPTTTDMLHCAPRMLACAGVNNSLCCCTTQSHYTCRATACICAALAVLALLPSARPFFNNVLEMVRAPHANTLLDDTRREPQVRLSNVLVQGVGANVQPTEILRLQQELVAAHKLVSHLKIELEAANGIIDILRSAAKHIIGTVVMPSHQISAVSRQQCCYRFCSLQPSFNMSCKASCTRALAFRILLTDLWLCIQELSTSCRTACR